LTAKTHTGDYDTSAQPQTSQWGRPLKNSGELREFYIPRAMTLNQSGLRYSLRRGCGLQIRRVKMDAIEKRHVYTEYKTASNDEMRESARQKYLNLVNMDEDWRWDVETERKRNDMQKRRGIDDFSMN